MSNSLAFVLCIYCATFHAAVSLDECYKILFDIMKNIQSKDASGFATMISTLEFRNTMVTAQTNLAQKSTSNTCANSREVVSFVLEALRAFKSYDSTKNSHVQCANVLAFGFRSNLKPCTSFGLYSLCLKSENILSELGMDVNKLQSFSGNGCESVNYSELTNSVPAEYTNFNAYKLLFTDYKKYSIPLTGSCADGFSTLVPDMAGCYKQDFRFIGRCLRERYVGYQTGNDHRTIENRVQSCITGCQSSMRNTCQSNVVRFLPWVLRLSKLTDRFLSTTLGTITVFTGEPSAYVGSTTDQDKKDDDLINQVLNSATQSCGQASKVTSICMTLRAYMHRFQLNPCLEWLMFYTCLRDIKAAYCGITADVCIYHKFLQGTMNTSPNVNNKWTIDYCENIDQLYQNNFFAFFRTGSNPGSITITAGFAVCK